MPHAVPCVHWTPQFTPRFSQLVSNPAEPIFHDQRNVFGAVALKFVVGEIHIFTSVAESYYIILNEQTEEIENSAITGRTGHFNNKDDADDLESSPGIVTEPTRNIMRATSVSDAATLCRPEFPVRIQMCAQTSGQTDIAVRHEGPP